LKAWHVAVIQRATHFEGNQMIGVKNAMSMMLAASLLATPALAALKTKTKSNQSNDRVQQQNIDRCAVSTSDGTTGIDASFAKLLSAGETEAAVQITLSASTGGKPIVATYDIKKNVKARNAGPAPVSACDAAPVAVEQDHAINTKGAGANNRTNQPIVTKDVDNIMCRVSGEAGDPVISIHLAVPVSDKVSVQDLSFMRDVPDDPGGGPRVVKRQDGIVCAMANGEASDVTMYLRNWPLAGSQ
jgi:hypothetical protein